MLKVKFHSNQQDAAEATDNTIKQLPGNGYLLRAREGEIYFDKDGFAILQTNNPGFMKFALIKQGYVKEIKDIYQGDRADV